VGLDCRASRGQGQREKRLVFLEMQGDGRGEDRVLLRPKNARWKESLEKIDAFGWGSAFLG
jgi:hypothetical protein